MTQLVVRSCEPDDRAAVGRMIAEAFITAPVGFPDADAVGIDHRWVAELDGHVAATMVAMPMDQWFGGRRVASQAVRSVAVSTARRGSGVGSHLVREVLRRSRAAGTRLSVLYPSVPAPYRSAGYELAGDHFVMSAPLVELPRRSDVGVEQLDAADVGTLADCYEQWASAHPGSFARTEAFWRDPLLRGPSAKYVYATREDGRITGYVIYTKERSAAGELSYYFDVAVADVAWTTPAAARALLASLATHSGLGVAVRWPGRPGDYWSRLLGGYAARVAFQYPWMMRVVDVPGALADRGYPMPVEVDVTFTVTDPVLPDNSGTYRLAVAGGKAEVTRASTGDGATLGVGPLAALYSGFVTAAELADEGALTGATATDVAALDAAFAGGRPRLNEMF